MRVLFNFGTIERPEYTVESVNTMERKKNAIKFWLPDNFKVKVTAFFTDMDYERLAYTLLKEGYIDMSEYPADYVEDDEDENDD